MPLATRRKGGVAGLPFPDTEAKIMDPDTGSEAGIDTVGELWLRGPQIFAGYAGEDTRAERLSKELLRDGWLATGDVAGMDEDGFFTIIDRREHMLVRNGQKVFPRQVKEVLFEHPAVALAQVTRDAKGRDGLHAHVVLHRNMEATLEELLKYCSKRLHPSALPDSISIDRQAPNASP